MKISKEIIYIWVVRRTVVKCYYIFAIISTPSNLLKYIINTRRYFTVYNVRYPLDWAVKKQSNKSRKIIYKKNYFFKLWIE